MDEQVAPSASLPWGPSDIIWGAVNIGKELGDRTPEQVYHLVRTGALKGAVVKMSRKQMIGSRIELRRIFPRLSARL